MLPQGESGLDILREEAVYILPPEEDQSAPEALLEALAQRLEPLIVRAVRETLYEASGVSPAPKVPDPGVPDELLRRLSAGLSGSRRRGRR